MRWTDIDFEGNALFLPETKSGRRVHTLPSVALALLVADARGEGQFSAALQT